MLLSLTLARIHELMTCAVVDAVHASIGMELAPGARLVDLHIDLSEVAAHDCPPVSHYRIVLRDRAWLRRIDVSPGDSVQPGATLALCSTEAHESLDAPVARPLRVTVAGILPEAETAWGSDA